jgi:hypothetical protein
MRYAGNWRQVGEQQDRVGKPTFRQRSALYDGQLLEQQRVETAAYGQGLAI